MDETRHAGRVAIVTGAGYGIGRATASRLAREGAVVIGCDVSDEGIASAREEFEAAGLSVALEQADVTDQVAVDRLVQGVLERHGRIDILANVAGIMDWFLPAHEVDDATWNRVLDVNLAGPMRLTRAALPSMMEQKSGSIVNVGSVGGLRGGAAGAAYTASKHALVGYTRSVAWTYHADGVRCNVVCPGGVETNIGTTAQPRSQWGMAQLGPIHASATGMAKPDEIATLISWLASGEASNVNGAVVVADGGWSAG
ncbi:MAG: SDR family NAD(P)-dependent oxidoreductase [Chloroflexi bacterium]|nr:SDR family NAD(P)-dependent oxidoreductase [Chloroflexota bacterium]